MAKHGVIVAFRSHREQNWQDKNQKEYRLGFLFAMLYTNLWLILNY